jgi:Xylose isomerase-like TIM barrel
MRAIGFSTGSLGLGDFRLGLRTVHGKPTAAIELSALREAELAPLVQALDHLDLRQFTYISFHAPSRFTDLDEMTAVSLLRSVAARGWPIIVHPDAVQRFELWACFGELTCIENMDKRKHTGRTARELAEIFRKLPQASLCFDVGHARQVDPSMCEAERILRQHGSRLKQLHVSDVNSESVHEPLSFESVLAFRRIAHLIPEDLPVILETPVSGEGVMRQVEQARLALGRSACARPSLSGIR